MSAKQLPGGVIQFSGEIVFRHDDPPVLPGRGNVDERVAILAALSILTKTELLDKAPPYLIGKLKERLEAFNRKTSQWKRTTNEHE